MRVVLVLAIFATACIAPEPPGGQFICNVDEDCPDDFTCESDWHCYDRLPLCFFYGQQPGRSTGCAPGEGCYWRDGDSGGPVCQPPGFIGQYGVGCDPIEFASLLEQRCAPGMVCVPIADQTVCLRACDSDATCNGLDTCSLFLELSERQHWWLGNYIAFCEPPPV